MSNPRTRPPGGVAGLLRRWFARDAAVPSRSTPPRPRRAAFVEGPSRRAAIRQAGAGLAAVAVLGTEVSAALAGTRERRDSAGEVHGRRWGMVIDLDRCTGCGSCTVACRQENNVPTAHHEAKYQGTDPEWMSMLWRDSEELGLAADPDAPPTLLPLPCQHCATAPCVKVCPVNATYKDSSGLTLQIWERCIGCRYCMVACPYSRRSFNWDAPRWDGTMVQMLNPDVGTRPAGVVEKCTFCYHRLRRAFEDAAVAGREPTNDELHRLPACAASCPANAITFGDLHDPTSEVSRLRQTPRGFRLLSHLGTDPSVIYLNRDKR